MNTNLIVAGGLLIVLGIIAYVYPITSAGSASDVNDLCNSALGTIGKVLSSQVRENCQTAKYIVVGTYGLIGVGALLVIVGSVIRHGGGAPNQLSESPRQPAVPLSTSAKRAIVIGIGVVAAIVIGAFAYQLSLQPNIEVSNFNVSTNPNNQVIRVIDQGRVSNSGNFYYTSQQNSWYYLVFSNEFSVISTKSVGLQYTDKGQSLTSTFEVPPGTYKSIPVYAYSGQSVSGGFNVAGGSGNDVDFYISTQTCSETVSFSFNLSNYGSVNGNAQLTLKSDGSSIWSNSYFVETQKQVTESGSAAISDCNQHDFKMVVNAQQRVA